MRRFIYISNMILLLFIISGCTDKLGVLDWSGQVTLKQISNEWAYRNIASSQVHPISIKSNNRLADFQNELLLEKVIKIGTGEYLFKSQFDNDKLSLGNDIIDILLKTDKFTSYGPIRIMALDINTKQKMELIPVKEYESGDPWNRNIEDSKSNDQTKVLERKGDLIYYFKEPSTQQNFIITASYHIKSTADRKVDKDGNFVKTENHYEYNNLSVTGSASINLGWSQCLIGTKVIKKQEVKFYVLDWNLDGQFSEDDVVWSGYTNNNYEFNKPIRLTGSWNASKDNTYRLKLIKPDLEKESYQLEIKLVSRGKR